MLFDVDPGYLVTEADHERIEDLAAQERALDIQVANILENTGSRSAYFEATVSTVADASGELVLKFTDPSELYSLDPVDIR